MSTAFAPPAKPREQPKVAQTRDPLDVVSERIAIADRLSDTFLKDNQAQVAPALDILKQIDKRGANPYHDTEHTRMVMNGVIVLWADIKGIPLNRLNPAQHPELTELLLAAAYHDIGQFQGAKGHEQRGSDFARESLSQYVGEAAAQRIATYILATRMEFADGKLTQVKASTFAEKILQDADMFNLGGTRPKEQWDISCRLFQETSTDPFKAEYVHSLDAISFGTKLFANHQYQTESAKRLLNPGKAVNLAELRAIEIDLTFKRFSI